MAAGVPVVASDTQSNRELIVDDECGFLIPLGTRAGRELHLLDKLIEFSPSPVSPGATR